MRLHKTSDLQTAAWFAVKGGGERGREQPVMDQPTSCSEAKTVCANAALLIQVLSGCHPIVTPRCYFYSTDQYLKRPRLTYLFSLLECELQEVKGLICSRQAEAPTPTMLCGVPCSPARMGMRKRQNLLEETKSPTPLSVAWSRCGPVSSRHFKSIDYKKNKQKQPTVRTNTHPPFLLCWTPRHPESSPSSSQQAGCDVSVSMAAPGIPG